MSTSYFQFTEKGLQKRLNTIKPYIMDAKENVDALHIRVSTGNSKLGTIPSISLLPVFDCGNCAACKKLCYDLRYDMIYTGCRFSRTVNSAIANTNLQRYFREIDAWLTLNYPRAFRWHVGGDIKSDAYFAGMIDIAVKHSDIKFLVFTKMFSIVNEYLDDGGVIPGNLKVIFSGWPGMDMPNPHRLPSAHPLFDGGLTSAHDGAKLCTGNCTECVRENRLCWAMDENEEVVFPVH